MGAADAGTRGGAVWWVWTGAADAIMAPEATSAATPAPTAIGGHPARIPRASRSHLLLVSGNTELCDCRIVTSLGCVVRVSFLAPPVSWTLAGGVS